METCNTCGVELNKKFDPLSGDCGGHCIRCMADSGDPECIEAVQSVAAKMAGLKEVAASDVCQSTEWVTQDWCEKHFGSEAEAKFVTTASPAVVMQLFAEIDHLALENAALKK